MGLSRNLAALGSSPHPHPFPLGVQGEGGGSRDGRIFNAVCSSGVIKASSVCFLSFHLETGAAGAVCRAAAAHDGK